MSEAHLEFCNLRYRDRFPSTDIADFLQNDHDVYRRKVSDRFPCTDAFRFDGRWIFSHWDQVDPDVHFAK